MPRLDLILKLVKARQKAVTDGLAASFARGAVAGGVKVAPDPAVSPGATGRTRRSITVSKRQPKFYDPGVRDFYAIPIEEDGERAARGRRKIDESVFLTVGTKYYPYIDGKYPIIKAAAKEGLKRMKKEKRRIVKRSRRVSV